MAAKGCWLAPAAANLIGMSLWRTTTTIEPMPYARSAPMSSSGRADAARPPPCRPRRRFPVPRWYGLPSAPRSRRCGPNQYSSRRCVTVWQPRRWRGSAHHAPDWRPADGQAPHQRCDPRLLPHVTHGLGPSDDHALDLAHAVENVKLADARRSFRRWTGYGMAWVSASSAPRCRRSVPRTRPRPLTLGDRELMAHGAAGVVSACRRGWGRRRCRRCRQRCCRRIR